MRAIAGKVEIETNSPFWQAVGSLLVLSAAAYAGVVLAGVHEEPDTTPRPSIVAEAIAAHR